MKNKAIEDINAQGRIHQGEEQVLFVGLTRVWTGIRSDVDLGKAIRIL